MISVVIATFNVESVLQRALDSLCCQNNQELELVIIDGASKDKTVDIAKNFIFNNKVIISEPDDGIYDAFNKGWKAAHGDWIYYLGADDELLPNAFDRLLNESEHTDCIYGNVFLRDEKNQLSQFHSKPANVLPKAMCCSHQAILMKKSVLESLNGFDCQFKVSADYELLLRAYLGGFNFKYVDTNVAYFSCDSGASSKLKWSSVVEQYHIYKKNKANSFPCIAVAWNFLKRLIRMYIFDPKKQKK